MERDRSCQTGPGASATEEPEAAEDVLELSVPSPGDAADSPGSAARPLMDPRRESALKFLEEVLSRRTRQAEEEARQLRADEARLIKAVVPRLTGLSLIPDPREARIVVRHRLHEFLSTVPLPPNATPAQRRALHREALTMLLRLGPRDDTERMLVMQMIAAHMASLSCFARAAAPDTPDAAAALHRAQAQKMSRVFLDLERTLRRRGAAIGAPEMAEIVDPEAFADTLLGLLRSEGFHIDDDGTLS